MKAVRIHEFGNVDVVKMDEVEIPQPMDNEVLVKVHGAGINPIDWKVREGYYAQFMENCFPFPMGWDFSGTITKVGKSSQYKIGDEVFGLIRFFEPAGTFAEYVCAPEHQIYYKPKNMDHLQAAATPLVALTAWQALFEVAELKANQTVLIHAAGGGVGQFAVQLTKWKGAKVIAVASESSRALLTTYSVDEFIDYHSERFENKAKSVDVVLNLVGDADTAMRSLQVMKAGGKIISFLGSHAPEVVAKAEEFHIDTPSMIVKPNGEQLKQIAHLIEDKVLAVKLEKQFSLSQVKEALNLVQTGHCHGKVVLKIV
jgi:NADPH:quinone reductase-like Zn-dependent oxidoreductase